MDRGGRFAGAMFAKAVAAGCSTEKERKQMLHDLRVSERAGCMNTK